VLGGEEKKNIQRLHHYPFLTDKGGMEECNCQWKENAGIAAYAGKRVAEKL